MLDIIWLWSIHGLSCVTRSELCNNRSKCMALYEYYFVVCLEKDGWSCEWKMSKNSVNYSVY